MQEYYLGGWRPHLASRILVSWLLLYWNHDCDAGEEAPGERGREEEGNMFVVVKGGGKPNKVRMFGSEMKYFQDGNDD